MAIRLPGVRDRRARALRRRGRARRSALGARRRPDRIRRHARRHRLGAGGGRRAGVACGGAGPERSDTARGPSPGRTCVGAAGRARLPRSGLGASVVVGAPWSPLSASDSCSPARCSGWPDRLPRRSCPRISSRRRVVCGPSPALTARAGPSRSTATSRRSGSPVPDCSSSPRTANGPMRWFPAATRRSSPGLRGSSCASPRSLLPRKRLRIDQADWAQMARSW